jgi:hypothetical protein
MTIDRLQKLASLRQAGLLLLAASTLALASATPALAQLKGDFTVFTQCPTENLEVTLCVYAQSSSGELVIGKRTVPITHTITLQGGSIQDQATGQEKFVAAANGETLSRTALAVPGGLPAVVEPSGWPTKLQKIYNKYLEEGLTGVTATVELVGKPGISVENLLLQTEVALSLPVRIKLDNGFLGSECYIGSKGSPVTLNLTTGTTSPPAPNQPLSGAVGQIQLLDGGQVVLVEGVELVDNAFSVPAAEGCGGALFSFWVDPSVAAGIGLPSAAGHNTAILEGTQRYAEAAEVRNQKK